MKDKKKMALGMGIGIGIGAVIGVALDNIGTWIAIGLAFGAGIGHRLSQENGNDEET